MKILHVSTAYKPSFETGGVARSCYEITRHLARRRHDVTVYTTDRGRERVYVARHNPVRSEGVKVYYFRNISNHLAMKAKVVTPYHAPFVASRQVKEFDLIHIHEHRSLLAAIVAYHARRCGIPYVLQARGSLATYTQKGRLKRVFDTLWGYRILRDASRVFALNRTEAGHYRNMGVNEDRIEIVPNGIDLPEFEDLPERGSFRSKYSLDDRERIILYLGRIDQTKGLDVLARAFAQLSKSLDDARLVIVGPDDGYLRSLKRSMAHLRISDQVLFTGSLYGRDKVEAYVDATVFVTPSFYGFPNTFVEACATGTPIVTTDRGDQLDWLDGHTGYVTPYDESELAKAITSLLTYGSLAKQFGANGQQIVRDRFNWATIAEQVESIYESVQKGHTQ